MPANHDIGYAIPVEESGWVLFQEPFLMWTKAILQAQSDQPGTRIEQDLYKQPETSFLDATFRENIAKEVAQEAECMFRRASYEDFENDSESEFKGTLSLLISRYGGAAVNEIKELILNNKPVDEVAGEALRRLGDIDDEPTQELRKWLLEQALTKCSSPVVRHGANIGLAFMDDPRSIPILEDAIEGEASALLKKLMRKTVAQLEKTHSALAPT
jgi:hypothetical protein